MVRHVELAVELRILVGDRVVAVRTVGDHLLDVLGLEGRDILLGL